MAMLKNIGLVLLSLVAVGLFSEFILFRFLFLPAEIPLLRETDGTQVLKYAPNQNGRWRIHNGVDAPYRINSDGWNSALDSYPLEHPGPENTRVAIIGDSFVEALQVPFDKSLAETLAQKNNTLEVLRFGISGAPLSQYVFMYETEVIHYAPDIVVFVVISNDFFESLEDYGQASAFSHGFRKWRIKPDGTFFDVGPSPYSRGWISLIKRSNLYGYFVTRKQVDLNFLKRHIFGNTQAPLPGRSPSAQSDNQISLASAESEPPNFVQYRLISNVFAREIQRITNSSSHPPHVLVLLNGAMGRDSQACKNPTPTARLKKMSESLRGALSNTESKFFDLDPVFQRAECEKSLQLMVPMDGHWSTEGHLVVADYLYEILPPKAL